MLILLPSAHDRTTQLLSSNNVRLGCGGASSSNSDGGDLAMATTAASEEKGDSWQRIVSRKGHLSIQARPSERAIVSRASELREGCAVLFEVRPGEGFGGLGWQGSSV